MIRTSQAIRQAIALFDINARVAHGRARVIREEIEQSTNAILVSLVRHEGSGNPDQMSIGPFIGNAGIQRLAELKLVLELIEASPEHALAMEGLAPLQAELETALAREHQEALAVAAARSALTEAEEAAREKLMAKVDTDPGVVKARQALAGIRRLGEPLGELASDAEELAADLH